MQGIPDRVAVGHGEGEGCALQTPLPQSGSAYSPGEVAARAESLKEENYTTHT